MNTLPVVSLALLLYVLLNRFKAVVLRFESGGTLVVLIQGHYLEHIHFEAIGAMPSSVSVTYCENIFDI